MFVRTKRNSFGSVSIQIISKDRERYKVMKSFSSTTTQQEIYTTSKHIQTHLLKMDEQQQELFGVIQKYF